MILKLSLAFFLGAATIVGGFLLIDALETVSDREVKNRITARFVERHLREHESIVVTGDTCTGTKATERENADNVYWHFHCAGGPVENPKQSELFYAVNARGGVMYFEN